MLKKTKEILYPLDIQLETLHKRKSNYNIVIRPDSMLALPLNLKFNHGCEVSLAF